MAADGTVQVTVKVRNTGKRAGGRGKLALKPRDLAYWDAAGHVWRVEKEQVRVLGGGSSDKLPVQAILEVTTSQEFKPSGEGIRGLH